MKQFAATLGLFTLFSTLLFADIIVPRSIDDRLAGVGFINEQTTTLLNFSGKKVVLNSRHSDTSDSRSLFKSELARDESGTEHNRSIVLLDQKDIDTMNNRELRNAIYASVGVRNSEISEGQWNLFRKTVKEKTRISKTGFENFYIMANFIHHINIQSEQSFFVAIIPREIKLQKILYQIEWFGQGAGGSSQIRMVFNQNFIAIPQIADTYSPFIIENQTGVADLVYSPQIIRAQGSIAQANISSGLMGEFANALSFYSTQSIAKKQIFNSLVKQYELTSLSQDQKQAIFSAAISLSHGLQDTTIHNTVFNGTNTHSLLALRGLPTQGARSYQGAQNIDPSWFNPYSILNKISSAGITTQFAGTLNNEFANLTPPSGQVVLGDKDLEDSQLFKQLSPLRNSLLQTDAFEQFVREIAYHINDNNINLDQVKNIFADSMSIFSDGRKPASKLKGEALALYQKIDELWKIATPSIKQELNQKNLALSDLKIQNAFIALASIQPRAIGKQ